MMPAAQLGMAAAWRQQRSMAMQQCSSRLLTVASVLQAAEWCILKSVHLDPCSRPSVVQGELKSQEFFVLEEGEAAVHVLKQGSPSPMHIHTYSAGR